jgi:hypothetical protein
MHGLPVVELPHTTGCGTYVGVGLISVCVAFSSVIRLSMFEVKPFPGPAAVGVGFQVYECYQDSLSFWQVAQRSIQIGPKVLDRLDSYFSGEDSLASNKAGAFLP